MNDVANESPGPFQGVAAVLILLAAGALVLAGGEIYGVIACSVSRRRARSSSAPASPRWQRSTSSSSSTSPRSLFMVY
jgi:hypothetical protein